QPRADHGGADTGRLRGGGAGHACAGRCGGLCGPDPAGRGRPGGGAAMTKSVIDAIVQRPRLIMMMLVMLSLAGLASYGNMARQEDPRFPDRSGLVTVIYPGTTAETIERLILEPLQDELSQVEEVLEFTASA